jgi:endoglucanase
MKKVNLPILDAIPVLIMAVLFTAIGFTAIGQPVKIHGRLKVEGTRLLDEHNHPYALRGVSYGWSCFWPRFYNAGTVDWLYKDWNCSVLRAAMGVEPKGGYIEDPAGSKALIEAVVDGAIRSGIYVIIDWHSHHVNLQEAKTFFGEMAAKYAKYPNIIYELFNEPAEANWPLVKAYAEAVIKVIREKDPDNIILVGCPKWDQEIQLPAADPIKGYKNLMYTMHFYAGTHKQWLRDRTDAAIKAGLPVFISESAGMESSGDGPIDYKEWQLYIDWINKNNLTWITWSVSDKNESCSVLKPSAGSTGHWKDGDLNESGVKIREYLKGYPPVRTN